ncbi:MAG: Hsp70 family protein [Candidatus Coatesbacteria bacterium]|nr:Hsp70 family protein [Candidatus Coatesbacteria bacterium]
MGITAGIDLGTSTSEIGYLKNGFPYLIPNHEGKKITPSVVGMSPQGELLVGDRAKSQQIANPSNTIAEIKRHMGTNYRVKFADKLCTPQEISAFILRYLKSFAEDYLGEIIEEAVISVPAYFSDTQRQATKDAGELAGFKVERIINEPTAAALAYGIRNLDKNQHLLVYDLGGGTFDVSILEMFDGVLEVKASAGNNRLGGTDFDQRIMDFVLAEINKQFKIDLSNNMQSLTRIKDAAEQAKIKLSDDPVTLISLPYIGMKDNKPVSFETELTRTYFETMITDLLMSTLSPLDKVLHDADLAAKDIDIILLVGGSTKIPLLKQLITDMFAKEPRSSINPDEAVALGATVQAGIKAGLYSEEKDILITDVCPYTLGTDVVVDVGGELLPGVFDPLIKRNTTIPTTAKKIYATLIENQEKVRIGIYQGEESIAKENNFLGECELLNIPQGPAGKEKIEVEFSYDINGILKVKGIILSTSESVFMTIDTSNKVMSAEEKINAAAEVENIWNHSQYMKRVNALLESAEEKLSEMEGTEAGRLQEILENLRSALLRDAIDEVQKWEEELTDFLFNLE